MESRVSEKRQTALVGLPEEQKLELVERRIINGDSYQSLVDWLSNTYEFDTSITTMSHFFNSVEGEKLYKRKFREIRDTFAEEPLVDKSTRVLALRKKALHLGRVLDLLPMDEDDWLNFSSEYRQYLKMIRDEMEGLKISVDDMSPFEKVQANLKDKILGKIAEDE